MRRPLVLAVVVAFAAPGIQGAAAARPPRVAVEAPPALAPLVPEVERLAADALPRLAELTGAGAGGTAIRIVLAPEGSAAARSAPAWISGWAYGDTGVVVLLPARARSYPDDGLGPLVRHELAHVLVAQAAAGHPVPRWFDEGVAMAASGEWGVGDRARVALAVLTESSLPIMRLDRAFAGGESQVAAAYALAGDLVRDLERRFGSDVVAAILVRLASGESFDRAFAAATGVTLAAFEADYWSRRTFWDRWLPILSSSAILWSAIALLTLAAHRRKRREALELARRWEVEEPDEN